MDTQAKVKAIFQEFPETRDSKEKLIIKFWNKYYGVGITNDQAQKILQSEKINSILREGTFIQNTIGEYQPSKETRASRSHQRKLYQSRFSPNKNWNFPTYGAYNYQ